MNYIKCTVGDTLQINAYVNVSDDIKPDKVVFSCKDLNIEQELTSTINENGVSMWTYTFSSEETSNWANGIYTVTFTIYIQDIVQSKFCDIYLKPNINLTR